MEWLEKQRNGKKGQVQRVNWVKYEWQTVLRGLDMKARKSVTCSAMRHLVLFCAHTLDRPSSSLTRMKKEHYKSSCLQGRQQKSMEIIMTKLSSSINSEAGHSEGNQVNSPVCVKKINARLNNPDPAFCSSSRAFFLWSQIWRLSLSRYDMMTPVQMMNTS